MKTNRLAGQSLLETTLVLVAFLAVVLGMSGAIERLFVKQMLAQRVADAARWGALHQYDAPSIRNLVLYGDTNPKAEAAALDGLVATQIEVANPGCPGADCRIVVAVPARGVQSMQPYELQGH